MHGRTPGGGLQPALGYAHPLKVCNPWTLHPEPRVAHIAALYSPCLWLACFGHAMLMLVRGTRRAQIGVMYGNPEVTSGGNALKFYASVRLEVRRKQTIEGAKGENVGIRVKAKVRRGGHHPANTLT